MKIKNFFILIELIITLFLFGCSKVSGLDEQLIVYGIAVDKIDNMYEVTLQALNIQNTSDLDSKDEKKTLISINAKAESLIEATNKIENQTGKKILYSHALVLIIGHETAKNSIKDIVTFFSTNHKLRPTVEVLISNVDAKNIFLDRNKTISSEDIISITKIGKENNDAINSNIRYFLSDINNKLKAAKVWYIEYNNENVVCQKIALFKSDKLISIIENDTTKGVLLLYGKAKNISDNIKINDTLVSYKINKANSNISLKIKDNKPIFNIKLDISLEIYNSDNFYDKINFEVEKRLKFLSLDAINFCIKNYNCDIFNFHKYILNADANYFKTNLHQIENVISSADYNLSVNTKIKNMDSNQKISNLVY